MKLFFLKINLALTTSLLMLGFTSVQAQLHNSIITSPKRTFNSSQQLIFNVPPPPDDIDAPGNRSAGGTRGCEIIDTQSTKVNKKQLTALVPVYEKKDVAVVWGLTTTSYPKFWIYVPYLPTVDAEFSLQDEKRNIVYQTPISLSQTPGIISISLPSTIRALDTDKRYFWYFNIYCQPQQPPIFISGWVQRKSINLKLENMLKEATLKERVFIYGNNGYWYDALTTAAEIRHQSSDITDWVNLLQTVGLSNLSQESLVECCSSKN
ncbi:DUF928 domain-containing protein [Nostoc sp. FACHB-110]|uniref:DUF928 domain-containing protein n=1 Tax=Nostoc sp. FACHB-110 TaxID=2692834 RepID=UPI001688F2B9|nr:DUF928 domain-containing protein [Nostoc sp. FACHB-110]MBD2441521.1 DUF928 domain-containing protein [Nostoc sp. FACHB-110]